MKFFLQIIQNGLTGFPVCGILLKIYPKGCWLNVYAHVSLAATYGRHYGHARVAAALPVQA